MPGAGGMALFRTKSWLLAAVSLWSLRGSQEQSSDHLPQHRASNPWHGVGGEAVASQVPPAVVPESPSNFLASHCVLMAVDVG